VVLTEKIRIVVLATCCSLLCGLSGCDQGPERVPVAGRVLIDGQPLTKGTIRFVPETGRAASSQIAQDGSFRVISKSLAGSGMEIKGLFPDTYRVAVLSSEPVDQTENSETRWLAPQRYADFRTSGLEVDIKKPNEKMIVELTWEGAEESDEEESESAETEKPSDGEELHKTTPEQKSDS
jgi:hypothetical protein